MAVADKNHGGNGKAGRTGMLAQRGREETLIWVGISEKSLRRGCDT